MKLSIATPTFGKPKYLEKSIESVCKQTVSTTYIVCGGNLTFENKVDNDCVKIVTKSPDPGMVGCWNAAANMATTPYLAFMADDNTLEPRYTEVMVDFMEQHPECDLVFCNQNHMDAHDNVDHEKSKEITTFFGRDKFELGMLNAEQYETILRKNGIPLEACVIRKNVWEKYGPFLEQSKGTFDQEFLFRMLLNDIKIGFVPDYLMNFRWHDDAYCVTHKEDHIRGGVWTNESLMAQGDKYYGFFKDKNIALQGRLLRHPLKPGERKAIVLKLLKEKGGLKVLIKNTLAKIVGKK